MRLLWLWLAMSSAPAMDLAIIIDDLGYSSALGKRTLALPGPITVAVLPGTPFAQSLALEAERLGVEIMLHLPMANKAGLPLGPYGLTVDMTPEQHLEQALAALASLPGAQGFNNHQGSLLTESAAAMGHLFAEMPNHLYFIDSLTSAESKAGEQASAYGWRWGKRDVFLDHQPTDAFVRQQLQLTKQRLQRDGHALVIGHPYEVTLRLLADWLPHWQAEGVQLLSVSEYLLRHGHSSAPDPQRQSGPAAGQPAAIEEPARLLSARETPDWPQRLEF